MIYTDELVFEADVIKKLTEHGWSKQILKNKTEEQLIDNWADILFNNNKGIDRLNNEPLTDGEKQQLIEQIKKLKSPLMLNKFVNGKTVYIKRDNENDHLHFGKEVPLDIYDRNQIAGGKSVYQIVEQPIFKAKKSLLPNRRGDLMLLINGLPLIHIELKKSGVPISQAIEQIKKYSHENVFTGFFSLVQVFVAMNPEETKYFANPGDSNAFNDRFYFKWADKNNEPYESWDKNIEQLLSIPMAHKLIGFYTVPDTGDGVLKVMRSYQYYACEAINARVEKAEWTAKDKLGGYICHTTGSGKTMTSFKAAQLLSQSKRSDKVVFLMDRIELGIQSAEEYKNFKDEREDVQQTENTYSLISKLTSNDSANTLIVTSIQKMSNIQAEEGVNERDIEKIRQKKIVFIIDECHRSTFGEMLADIKRTFPTALYFGFTGTPIYEENEKHDNTTTTVFGNELHRYSIADGIRDGNVLGFDPSMVLTYKEQEIRQKIGLREAGVSTIDEIYNSPSKLKKYQEIQTLPLCGHWEDNGDKKTYIKGLEDYIEKVQYRMKKDEDGNWIYPIENQHPYQVVKDILDNWKTLSVNGKFHAIFATDSIPEACDYYHLFKLLMGKEGRPVLKIAGVFDETLGNDENSIPKEEALKEILDDYNKEFNQSYDISRYSSYKKDVALRLAHKKTYLGIEKINPDQQLNIVIVVDQMLTGFDSKWVNTIYLDKVLKYEGLIQAFSRTNRIFGKDKPFGIIKWYRYPHTMKKNMEEAFELYSGSNPYGVFVEKLEGNLIKINSLYAMIASIFKSNNDPDFSSVEKMPKADKAMFAKSFAQLSRVITAATIQGFVWNKDSYLFSRDGLTSEIKMSLNENNFLVLAQRYKDLFADNEQNSKREEDNPLDLDSTAIEISTDQIDYAYLNGKFKKWLASLYDGTDEKTVSELNQQLHASFASLSQDDQKIADIILFDIQDGKLKILPGESKIFNDYITEYKLRFKNDQIHRFAVSVGFDENKLRTLMNSKPTDANLNNYGRFDDLKKTMDASLASAFFEKKEGRRLPRPLVISKAENLVRDFIVKGGFDL